MKQVLRRISRKLGLTSSGKMIQPDQPVDIGGFHDRALSFIKSLQGKYYTTSSHGRPIDSMTTPNELTFLREYARDLFSGKGKIVDLGCWFGATSAALAEGLASNSRALGGNVIEAYDLFDWEDWMDPIKEQIGMKVDLASGDCFLSIVKQNLAEHGSKVNLYKQDLTNYVPPEEWEIELLFVDAMKNWELADALAKNFFVRLIGKQSLIIMQDFAFYDPIVATNHLLMWHLRDCFKPLHHVPDSCSVAFVVDRCPTHADMIEYKPSAFTEDDIEAAYRYCLPLVQQSMQIYLLVARLCHHLMCQQKQGSIDALACIPAGKLAKPLEDTIQQSLNETYSPASEDWSKHRTQLTEEIKKQLLFD